MASKVGICNRALNALGVRARIASLEEGSEPARKCNLIIQDCIDEVLRAYDWNCAQDRASLAQSATAPVFGYDYKYALPVDCLRVIQMEEKTDVFKIEGRFLLTDESTCKILYIKQITDTGVLDPLCRRAVSARMAAELAFTLTNSNTLQDTMWSLYGGIIQEAQEIDAQEGTAGQWESESWIDERG